MKSSSSVQKNAQIIYMADKHNEPTSVNALLEALPLLIEQGFDTLCIETASEPKTSLQKRKKMKEIDYRIKVAIETKNDKEITRLARTYGHDIIEAERGIETHSQTHLAGVKLIDFFIEYSRKMRYVPIDVKFPEKTKLDERNDHMEKQVREAISESKTKKIVVFCGYLHIGNVFGGDEQSSYIYNRGLASRLNIKASFYFAYSSQDGGYKSIQKAKDYAPLINLEPIREIQITNNNYQPFINMLQSDLTAVNTTVQNPSNIQKYAILQPNMSEAEQYNRDTISYIQDLGGTILAKQDTGKGYIFLIFSIESSILKKDVREKLALDRLYIPGEYKSHHFDRLKNELACCTIEKAIQNQKPGYYLTFLNDTFSKRNTKAIVQSVINQRNDENSCKALIGNKARITTREKNVVNASNTINSDPNNIGTPKYQ